MISQPLQRNGMMIITGLMLVSVLIACEQRATESESAGQSSRRSSRTAVQDFGTAQRSVVAETLAYAEVDQELVKGHFVFPEDMVDPLPAVILIHDWWGLDDDMRSLADRIAGEGFIVLAVDLFGGKTAANAPEARELMLDVVENPDIAMENIRRAFDWVLEATGAPEAVTIGYGLGGGLSLNAAMELGDKLAAAVMYYGQVTDNEDDLATIAAPILGIFASDDTVVPLESVTAFQAALQKLEKTHTIESFNTAKRGFANPGNRNFSEPRARNAWQLTMEFLGQHLDSAADNGG